LSGSEKRRSCCSHSSPRHTRSGGPLAALLKQHGLPCRNRQPLLGAAAAVAAASPPAAQEGRGRVAEASPSVACPPQTQRMKPC
jgi:hypothetical protein